MSLAIAEPEDRATLALYTFVRAGEFVARLWVHQVRTLSCLGRVALTPT